MATTSSNLSILETAWLLASDVTTETVSGDCYHGDQDSSLPCDETSFLELSSVVSDCTYDFVDDILGSISNHSNNESASVTSSPDPEIDLSLLCQSPQPTETGYSYSDTSLNLSPPITGRPATETPCGDYLSSPGHDEGYSSLSECSASISDIIDPADFSTLLQTLTSSLPDDLTTFSVVTDGACYNLFQYAATSITESPNSPTLHSAPATTNNSTPATTVTSGGDLVKPDMPYIELIGQALLDAPDCSLVLGDIYQWIMDRHDYYKYTNNSWRSSIRHNLSVNECFVKGKRTKSGRGVCWSIHPSCINSFQNGDFDRRKARRQVQHCNRAFDSALSELKQLQKDQAQLRATTTTSSVPVMTGQYSSGPADHWTGSVGYVPQSSTPVRSHPYAVNYVQPSHHGYQDCYGYHGY